VLSCAMAIIMAGSGDVDCLQRLRYAHGKYAAQNKFGMHMANHMAMGLLFLGGGRYTLGTSDAAICALLASFYPRFPLFGSDNRFHLQALRHIWVLAVEPRCLITRDIDTRKVIFLPVKIKVKESHGRVGSLQLLAPTLTHDFDAIRSLRVDSPRYWPFFVDYEQMPQYRDAFIRNQTLWVKRRRGYLGYYEDPHCTRSSFVRSSGGAAGDIVCLDSPELLDAHNQSSRDFYEFMASFTEDDRITTFAERLCSDDTRLSNGKRFPDETRLRSERAWSTFCQAALMDCFAGDKPSIIPSYMTVHSIRAQAPEETGTFSAGLIDLIALQEWYRRVSMVRPPLVRIQVMKSVFLSSANKMDALRQNAAFMGHLRDYVNGRSIRESEGHGRRIVGRQLAFYLVQSETPSASSLATFRNLYVKTVHAGVAKRLSPDSLRSALMMVMKETAQSMGMDWHWQAIHDIIICWREG
jgi:anaphase-promoting complex subunit 1